MKDNNAMLLVAKMFAEEHGYILVDEHSINARNDSFWGNRALGLISQTPITVKSCKYIIPIFEEDKDENIANPKIEIDMHWGNPRLSVRLLYGTSACLTYENGNVKETQSSGADGLELAIGLKDKIDFFIQAKSDDFGL